MKAFKLIFKLIIGVIVLGLLYVIISIIHGTVTDFKPEEVIKLDAEGGEGEAVVSDSILTFLNWNVGYGGLGKECNFFYDSGGFFFSKGKMVRASKKVVEKNVQGVSDFLENQKADFYLLQEVDKSSKRSYKINQYEKYGKILGDYSQTFAVNYKSARVPLPVCEPWKVMGKMHSGLATYSRFKPTETTRYQLPGEYGWPTRIFQLDRCMALHRYPVKNGKELVVINTHNSAYDEGGVLKKQQMAYLKEKLETEYAKGNYVLVGGDWNQCPPNFKYDSFMKDKDNSYEQINIPMDYLPDGWVWAYDPTIPTNRKLTNTYEHNSTFVTLIDFYLLSPNLKLLEVKGVNQEFEYSDHQPVLLKVEMIE